MLTLIDVVDQRGKTHRLIGRAAEMVALILVYQERINASDQGHLTIHYAGRSLKPELLELLTGT